ncbi:MAG TPA: hypothetical protein VN698_09275 [Bacteroidia bacterium]|nr:hypothetical protein [Bacteroidia bacterium]
MDKIIKYSMLLVSVIVTGLIFLLGFAVYDEMTFKDKTDKFITANNCKGTNNAVGTRYTVQQEFICKDYQSFWLRVK